MIDTKPYVFNFDGDIEVYRLSEEQIRLLEFLNRMNVLYDDFSYQEVTIKDM
jgi:hypothetical protein